MSMKLHVISTGKILVKKHVDWNVKEKENAKSLKPHSSFSYWK